MASKKRLCTFTRVAVNLVSEEEDGPVIGAQIAIIAEGDQRKFINLTLDEVELLSVELEASLASMRAYMKGQSL